MLIADNMRNLRVGPIASAGGVNDATIRGWVSKHGLKLGDREGRQSGNPRYDLADCGRVFLLRLMTQGGGMAPESAVWAVNKAWAHIALIADQELAAMASPTNPPACSRYIMRLPAAAGTTELNPTIRLFSDEEEAAERNSSRGLWMETIIDLREIVRAARDRLAGVLNQSVWPLRHDFADAPEPVRTGDLAIG